MATKFSTGLRVHMLITGSIKAALDGGTLRLFSGTVPETADAAESGTRLLTLTKDGDGFTGLTFENTAITQALLNKSAAEVWSTLGALASGEASYFRFVADGDTGSASATQARIQGTAGGGGTDLFLINPTFNAGDPYTLPFFRIALPTY